MYVRMLPASAIALVLGCAGQAASPEVPADHPASPNAVVAPVPQRSATLAIDSDQRMAPPSTTSATRGGHHADDGTAPQLPNDASTHSGHDHHAAEPSNTAATRPAALARTQQPSGLWHTVIDDPATYLESTLATMAAYALHEGIRHGVLDASRHGDMERKARAAMHSQIARDGTLQLVSDATPVGARAVYATRPFGTFPWGQGPLLLALCQEVE